MPLIDRIEDDGNCFRFALCAQDLRLTCTFSLKNQCFLLTTCLKHLSFLLC